MTKRNVAAQSSRQGHTEAAVFVYPRGTHCRARLTLRVHSIGTEATCMRLGEKWANRAGPRGAETARAAASSGHHPTVLTMASRLSTSPSSLNMVVWFSSHSESMLSAWAGTAKASVVREGKEGVIEA